MKLTVLIERHDSGLLFAHVVQEGQRGTNLLKGRQVRELDTAKLHVQDQLAEDTGQLVEITWEGVSE